MNEVTRFIEWAGGPSEAASRLGCSLALIYAMRKGKRAVSSKNAKKIVAMGGRRFSLGRLLASEDAK
jgi:DNA-binding transcriptional regulator YdaS (Cro superfamily)